MVTAFAEGLGPGLMYLIVPFYAFYHLIKCWETTHRPFWMWVGALVSIVGGSLLHGLFGEDVGERALMAVPGSAATRKPVEIADTASPLRPPEITEAMTEEEALRLWQNFAEQLQDKAQALEHSMLIDRRRQKMIKKHGQGLIAEIKVSNILDAATFDSVEAALRKFAGPDPDDFFATAYLDPSRKSSGMFVLVAPITNRETLYDSIHFGSAKFMHPKLPTISIATAPQAAPAQLKSLFDLDAEQQARLAKLGGEGTGAGFNPPPIKRPPPRSLNSLPLEGELELPFPDGPGGSHQVIYPSANCRFVAIGDNNTDANYRESWDLRERRRIGLIAGAIPAAHGFVLSPDGRSLAAIAGASQSVEIWSFETGQLIRRIDVNTAVSFVDFVGPDLVLIGTLIKSSFFLCEIASGRTLKTVVSPVPIDPASPAVGLDGKQLALASSIKMSAGVYSLETAKLVANWAVPPTQPFLGMTCKGMAFSPDGTEVAALFEDIKFARFMAWGPGGKVVNNALVALRTPESVSKPPLYQGRTLEWLPDGNGWLVYGQGIVDRQTGQRAWTIPEARDDSKAAPKRITENGDLLSVGGGLRKPALKSTRLPLSEIGEAIRNVRAGN